MVPIVIAEDSTWPHSKAKTAVLMAAVNVIRESGPRSATLKNIATKAGITEPAIFRHFTGIDGLFAGLFELVERIFNRISEASHANGLYGRDGFIEAMRSIVSIFARSESIAYILIHAEQVFREYPELRARLAELKLRDQDVVLGYLRQAAERGELRNDVDPLTFGLAINGIIFTSIIMWLETGYGFDLVEACERRFDDFRILMAPLPESGA